MTTIDPKVETGKLLTKEGAGHSKKSKTTKQVVIVNPEPNVQETKQSKSPKKTTKPDELVLKIVIKSVEPVVTEPTSVTIPSAEDMAKKISKKKKNTKKRQLVIPTKSSEEEEVPETPEPEPIIETTYPAKTVVIPPGVSSAKSSHEEVRT
ncbi:unnamed protein product [Lactuca saligna]|uniref:Uncharacterized protein n=1 Tax=Lactuca saligna TaxID=75948 RepID=A0AA36EAG2_LACSI|nr:unnamed protein product [Lactuca saligna]